MITTSETLGELKIIRDGLLKENEFKSMSESEKYAYIHGVLDMWNEAEKIEKAEKVGALRND